MRSFSLILSIILSSLVLNGQIVSGTVKDSSTGEPIAFVSIGVKNMTLGTITDEHGNFELEISVGFVDSTVRFSMISYEPQVFTINDLVGKCNIIRLKTVTYEISEVIIRPSSKLRKVGNTDYIRKGRFCGWGGSYYGKGNEIGLRIALGQNPVKLHSLHMHVQRQSYDSSLFRIHIRELENNIPTNELLTENIFFKLLNETGWSNIDLNSFNLVYSGDVMVSIEWIKVYGVIKDRVMRINNDTVTEYVNISKQKNKDFTFTRWGSENTWNILQNGSSPSMYLTIME